MVKSDLSVQQWLDKDMSTQNIYPKSCVYNCNTQIYWNTAENAYFEVFTKKKHICPNRSNNTTTNNANRTSPFYNKKPWAPKPKMSNSLELLTGPITEIQRKYEILSDIVTEYNGKVHGSQRDRDPKTGLIDLLVYYEVPQGQREEVKERFNNAITNRNNQQVVLQ